jgi:hypothetical protein
MPLGLPLDGLRADGLLYHEAKERAGWGGGNGLDPADLTAEQRDWIGLHGEPRPPQDGWLSADVLLDTTEDVLEPEYSEPRDNKRLTVDSDLLRTLAAIGANGASR